MSSIFEVGLQIIGTLSLMPSIHNILGANNLDKPEFSNTGQHSWDIHQNLTLKVNLS